MTSTVQELPQSTWDGQAVKAAFDAARTSQPWTLGYESVAVDELRTPAVRIDGHIPRGLRGVFYRNGPARHERGGERYGHRWDGDGMVQAFRFSESGLSHHGAFVRTEKSMEEDAVWRLL